MMSFTKWRDQMMKNVQHDIDHEQNRMRKTITVSGDIRSCLDDRSVYSVRKMSMFLTEKLAMLSHGYHAMLL